MSNTEKTKRSKRTTTITDDTKRRIRRGSKSGAIVKLAVEHPELTTREIGKLTDCDHSNVVRVLQRYNIQREATEEYKINRADILAGMQQRFLASITDADIQKTPSIQRVTAAGILYDKERLERGHGDSAPRIQINIVADPSNVAVQSVSNGDENET